MFSYLMVWPDGTPETLSMALNAKQLVGGQITMGNEHPEQTGLLEPNLPHFRSGAVSLTMVL